MGIQIHKGHREPDKRRAEEISMEILHTVNDYVYAVEHLDDNTYEEMQQKVEKILLKEIINV